MKKCLWLLSMIILWFNGMATNYFVNFLTGVDANNGTSTATPWKTITKVNSFLFANGDVVSFNRGNTWVGTGLVVSRNGVTYNAYGSGVNPIITGFNTVPAWVNLGGSVWESGTAMSTLTTANMVTINGVSCAMGRMPQSTYLTITAATGNTSLTSSSLNSAVTNWTGAQVVVRDNRFVITRGNITSASSGTINYTNLSASGASATVGFGFFIQNDVRTLTYQNAWYYNPTTKKIRVFSASSPGTVQVAAVDVLVSISSNIINITFNGIDFKGANTFGIQGVNNNTNLTIQNCNINFSGTDGINTNIADNLTITGSSVYNSNNNGIYEIGLESPANTFRGKTPTITHNKIHNAGTFPGMFSLTTVRNGYGVRAEGNTPTIQYNVLDTTGYGPIYYDGNNAIVSYNFINYFAFVIDDVGGIYTFNNSSGNIHNYINRRVFNNIILNGIGASAGTNSVPVLADGIYMDDRSNNINMHDNFTAFCGRYGYFYHNTNHTNNHNNTSFNNPTAQIGFQQDIDSSTNTDTVRSNFFIASAATQQCFIYRNFVTFPIIKFGLSDSNYWARPINDNLVTNLTFVIHPQSGTTNQSLAQWVTFAASIPQDVHSHKSSIFVTNINQFFYAYDSSQTAITVTLPAGTWAEVNGTTHNTGSVLLQPFTSIVLMNTGNNLAPIANAGTSKNITLPTTSVSQTGSGTDPDGTIAAFAWTFVSGPATGTATPSNTATTTLGGMTVAGTYVFQLKVTDNLGLTGVDTMSVVVNASAPPNLPPVVNAGGNKNIVQPVATVTQVGSATDPDGTIAGVLWTKTSGPGTFNIVSPTNTTTVINALTNAGVYQFTLTATDNLGLTGSQTITVTVNVPAPIPPVANAGSDQVLTWPTNSTTLNGSGTDADGTIVAYGWTRISGSGIVTSPSSQNTTITGLALGVSIFQLTVTDNSGLQATDNVQITLNQGSASLSASNTTQTYTGAPLTPTVTTTPPGISTATTLNGVGGGQINAGSYAAISGITDPNWSSSPISYTFTIAPASATINVSNLAQTYDGTSKSVTVTTIPAGLPVTVIYDGSATLPVNAGSYTIVATLNDANHSAAPVTTTLVIAKATPTISWTPTTPITYPTALSGSQLNASASVSGIFTYTPVSGTVLNANTQTLSADFAPTDATNYNSVNGTTRTIVVNQGTATINVSNLTQTFDGSPKPVTVSTTPLGLGVLTILYNGSPTAPTNPGTYPVTATLSNTNYTATPFSGNLIINTSAASIFITNLSQTYTGSPLPVTVTTNPAGLTFSITYNGSATVPTNAGTYTVIATITQVGHSGADTETYIINKAVPTISWANPSSIIFGTALSGIQLNASSPVAGSFAYLPIAGTFLPVGVGQTLSTTFTPTDASNYTTATANVVITVTNGTATLSLSNLAQVYDGTPKPVTATVSPNVAGVTVTYNGSATVPTNAGSYAVIVTLVNPNFTATPVNGTLVISKSSDYNLNWSQPSPIQQGSVITAAIDNATSTIAGTFSYNFPVGTQMNIPGTFILVATFTPSNSNYNSSQITVPLSVYGQPFLNFWIKHGSSIYLNIPPF